MKEGDRKTHERERESRVNETECRYRSCVSRYTSILRIGLAQTFVRISLENLPSAASRLKRGARERERPLLSTCLVLARPVAFEHIEGQNKNERCENKGLTRLETVIGQWRVTCKAMSDLFSFFWLFEVCDRK